MSVIHRMLHDLQERSSAVTPTGIVLEQVPALGRRHRGRLPIALAASMLALSAAGAVHLYATAPPDPSPAGAGPPLAGASVADGDATAAGDAMPRRLDFASERRDAQRGATLASSTAVSPRATRSAKHPSASLPEHSKPATPSMASATHTAHTSRQPIALPAQPAMPTPSVTPVPAVASAPPVASVPPVASAPTVASVPRVASTPRVASAPPVSSTPTAAPTPREKPRASIESRAEMPSSPQTGESLYRDALAQYDAGRSVDAIASLRAALARQPAHQEARKALVAILVERGENDAARALLDEALRGNPALHEFALLSSRLALATGRPEDATRTLLAASNADAPAELSATLAYLLGKAHRDRDAIPHWLAAIKRSPHRAPWWVGLGVAFEADDRPAEARAAYDRALSIGTLAAETADFARGRSIALR